MDTYYYEHFGFGKALKTGRFGTPWVKFHIVQRPNGDYEISLIKEYDDVETIDWKVKDNRIFITNTYRHVSQYPHRQKYKHSFLIPAGDYEQIVFKQENKF